MSRILYIELQATTKSNIVPDDELVIQLDPMLTLQRSWLEDE